MFETAPAAVVIRLDGNFKGIILREISTISSLSIPMRPEYRHVGCGIGYCKGLYCLACNLTRALACDKAPVFFGYPSEIILMKRRIIKVILFRAMFANSS